MPVVPTPAAPPSGSGSPHPPRQQHRAPSGELTPEQIAKLLSELDVVHKNMDVSNEVMNDNEPGRESADDAQLLEV